MLLVKNNKNKARCKRDPANNARKPREKKKNNFIMSSNNIPDIIHGEYEDIYDIHGLNQIILCKLDNEKNKLKSLKLDLEKEKEKIKIPQFINDRRKSLNKIQEIENEIHTIENENRIEEYKEQVEEYLQYFDEYEGENKLKIIELYLRVARKYINIDIRRVKKEESDICQGCGNLIKDTYYTNEIKMYICSICGVQKQYENNSTSENTSSQTSELENLNNYLRALNRQQGLQSINIPPRLYEDLDNYFTSSSINKLPGCRIKKLPLDSRGKKEGTNHKMLYIALEKTGYSDFYEDANVIAHNYWGWKLPSYSAYKSILIDRYKKMQPIFDHMVDKTRTSNINTQYRIFKDLEGVGYPCSVDEFKLPEDISELERIYKYMCDNCGDEDIIFIKTEM